MLAFWNICSWWVRSGHSRLWAVSSAPSPWESHRHEERIIYFNGLWSSRQLTAFSWHLANTKMSSWQPAQDRGAGTIKRGRDPNFPFGGRPRQSSRAQGTNTAFEKSVGGA